MRVVEILVPDIPNIIAVEVGPIGVADQDGGQQPGKQQRIFQDNAGLFVALLENVVAGYHHHNTGQRSSKCGKDEAELDAA